MAHHEYDPESGYFRICFVYPPHGGKRYKRSRTLKIRDERRADAVCGLVEETIRDLGRGVLTIPEGIDPGDFILSGGKFTARPEVVVPSKAITLRDIIDRYDASNQCKEASSRATERIHYKHLLRIIGGGAVVEHLEKKDVQAYVDRRAAETYKRTGKKTMPQTIKKELGTQSVICNWARDEGLIRSGPPTQKLRFQKSDEKHPFRSWADCERAAARGTAGVWESLYLDEAETRAVLDHARGRPIYPMLMFAAYTGARRSEMCRAEVDDIDLDSNVVRIREKKRDRSKIFTYRHVPLHPKLREALIDYLADHPGGDHLFCGQGSGPLTKIMASKRFRACMKDSKWQVLRGWHTFRHSFASNLARRGVPQPHIDELMGHETEAMRRRYRHLFPQDLAASVGRLFLE